MTSVFLDYSKQGKTKIEEPNNSFLFKRKRIARKLETGYADDLLAKIIAETAKTLSKMKTTLTLFLAFSFLAVAYADVKPPRDWKEVKLPEADESILFLVVHKNNGSIMVLKDATEDIEATSAQEYLEVKIDYFKETFGIEEETKISDTTIATLPAKSVTFKTKVADGKGTKIDMRYKMICVKVEGFYYNLLLSCRVGTERNYGTIFRDYLASITFD